MLWGFQTKQLCVELLLQLHRPAPGAWGEGSVPLPLVLAHSAQSLANMLLCILTYI